MISNSVKTWLVVVKNAFISFDAPMQKSDFQLLKHGTR
jgi:hypothetical protein